jgi:YidC/Oxa1 family membrane protein insertase
MDKQTVIAVILSVIVITVGFMIQNALFPPEQQQVSQTQQGSGDGSQGDGGYQQTEPIEGQDQEDSQQQEQESAVPPEGAVLPVEVEGISQQERVYRNEVMEVTFSPVGGSVNSIKLLEHQGDEGPVEMIQNEETGLRAFNVHFGGPEAEKVDALFRYVQTNDPNVIEFRRQFYVKGQPDQPFTMTKRYVFKPGEYLFELDVTIEHSVNEFIPLNFNETAYTLSFGPQIGPAFTELDGRNEYRRYYYYTNGSRESIGLGSGERKSIDKGVDWAGIVGKYFTVIGVPDATQYNISFSNKPEPDIPDASKMYFARPLIKSSVNTDVYRFYVGPKVARTMTSYNDADENAFNIGGLHLEEAMESRFLLGWLENILKAVLNTISQVVPNYGVAIIILTVLVKVIMWPLTRKSYQSTARMQELQPKIQELREKYKDNPQKMNQEMAAMYKKEGVNPLGGCLPLLLQMPFFIAMFGLFNNHFDLRGATFIPGWISDLSQPDTVLRFEEFSLPILGWNELHLLPIIFVGTQLMSSKLMQSPGASGSQMKMITYVLPIVFFFVLYNMPSGLMVYWIFTNILTAGQQYYNTKFKRHSQKEPAQKQPPAKSSQKKQPAKSKR